ncbi:MAG TPA: Zn-dependent hydrolase, partial [Firmicutes bacterium]|nr:Zn-dependent hydrolase [Bacillota bacterium]
MKSNLSRVIQDIEALSAFNSTPGSGVTRLAFTEEDRMAREYIK